MEPLFYIQLASSFFVGGSLIAFQSILAEKLPSKAAGIVLNIPSTSLVSFFFIALGISPEAAGKATAVVPLMMGVCLLFVTVYIYVARIKLSKPVSIFFSLCFAFLVWFLFAFSVSKDGFSNLSLSINAYILCALISYYFLTLHPHLESQHMTLSYSAAQKFFRVVFAGTVVAVTFTLAKTLGPVWGGVFSMFPAAYTSTLVAYHHKYDAPFLLRAFRNAPLGSISIFSFGIAGMYAYPALGALWGTLAAFAASLLTAYFLYKFTGTVSQTPSS